MTKCVCLAFVMGIVLLALPTVGFSDEGRWVDVFYPPPIIGLAEVIDNRQHREIPLENEGHWQFSRHFEGEVQVGDTYDADVASREITKMQPKLSAEVEILFNEAFALVGSFVFKQVRGTDLGDDVFFDHLGGYIKELKFEYQYQAFDFFAGKYNVDFGEAYDYDGIWADLYTSAYEITERLGVGVGYTMASDPMGVYTLAVSSFFLDTTFLSDSLGSRRGHTSKEDGGLSNTEDFSSFSVTFRGEHNPDNGRVFPVSHLTYAAGYVYQDADDVSVTDAAQKSYFVNLGFDTSIAADWSLDGLFEYVGVQNVEGSVGSDTEYFTAIGMATYNENWSVVVGYTYRNERPTGEPGSEDYLLHFSGIYDFGNGLAVEAGWVHQEDSAANDESQTVGAKVVYGLEF